jgi:hypothetical protein
MLSLNQEVGVQNSRSASDAYCVGGLFTFALHRRRGGEVVLHAFDLLEHNGDDLRELPLIERKRRLAKLLGRTKQWRAIQFV